MPLRRGNKEITVGALDERVILQSYTTAQNATGEHEKTWNAGTEIWAHVQYGGGSESEQNSQLTAKEQRTFIIRYRSTVTEQMRITYAGQYYNIRAINQIGRRQYLQLITDNLGAQ